MLLFAVGRDHPCRVWEMLSNWRSYEQEHNEAPDFSGHGVRHYRRGESGGYFYCSLPGQW